MPGRGDSFRRGSAGPSRTQQGAASRPQLRMPTSRRTTQVAPEPGQPGQGVPRRGMSVTSKVLVLLLVVAVLGVSYTSSVRAWLNQRNEQQTLSAQIAQQHEAIADLQRTRARWSDPAFIEDQARLRFGWVMPGERTFRVIGADGKVMGTPRTELMSRLPAQPGSAPWWSPFLHSVGDAAAPPPAKHPTSKPPRHPATVIPLGGGSGR